MTQLFGMGLSGPAWMIGAGALFAGANVAVQLAGMQLGADPAAVAFGQYGIALALCLPLIWRARLRLRRPWLNLWRILFAVAGVQFWVAGLAVVPIWQAIALLLLGPVMTSAGAGLILKEPMTPARLGGVVLGAAGGAVILAPWSDGFGAAAVLPLAAAVCWSASSLITKRLTAAENAASLTVSLILGLAGLSGVLALGSGAALSGLALGVVAMAGALTAAAQYALVRAYGAADAGTLQPFDHLKLPLNVGLGWLVFGFAPPGPYWLGAAMIVAAAAWVGREADHSS